MAGHEISYIHREIDPACVLQKSTKSFHVYLPLK